MRQGGPYILLRFETLRPLMFRLLRLAFLLVASTIARPGRPCHNAPVG